MANLPSIKNTRPSADESRSKTLRTIYELTEENGAGPSVRQITRRVETMGGIYSSSGVKNQIKIFQREGIIFPYDQSKTGVVLTKHGNVIAKTLQQESYASENDRGMLAGRLTSAEHPGLTFEVYATTAAGSGREAIEDRERIEVVPKGVSYYRLRIVGDSMIGDRIYEGDIVLVIPATEAMIDDGDIVVARLTGGASAAGESTVKRLYRDSPTHVRLQPSNPAMQPLIVANKDVEIDGKVVEVARLIT